MITVYMEQEHHEVKARNFNFCPVYSGVADSRDNDDPKSDRKMDDDEKSDRMLKKYGFAARARETIRLSMSAEKGPTCEFGKRYRAGDWTANSYWIKK